MRCLILGLILCLLVIPAGASAQSDWDVAPRSEAPDDSWSVPSSGERGGDADGSRGDPSAGPGSSRPATSDRPDASWDVPTRQPAPVTAGDEGANEGSTSSDFDRLPESSSRPQRSYQASAMASFDRQRFTLRLTPWTGIRETMSVSFAWTQPDYFELEAGFFLNPYARAPERRTSTLPDGDVLEWSVSRRVLEKGFYVRGSIAYPLFDQRGVSMRPWHANLLIPLELRVPIRAGEWTILAALHLGAEFTRWFNSGRGLAVGGTIGAPFWDLRARQSLGFRPILRFHIGLAF